MPRTIPGLSIDTKMIQDRLSQVAVGETITYDTLTALIGRDIRVGARSCLTSAIRRLLAEGFVFACVRGEGVKRLDDAEIVGYGPATIRKMRKAANRARVRLAAVRDFNGLSRDEQISHNTSLSILGVLAHMSKPSTVKALQTRIEQTQAALPLARTLEALSNS